MQTSESADRLAVSDMPMPPQRRKLLNVAILERRQLMQRTLRPELRNMLKGQGPLRSSADKLPVPPSHFTLQSILRNDRPNHIRVRSLKPLNKSGISPVRKDVHEAQETFKELYSQLLSKMSKLETLTKAFSTDGPFHALKHQTKHYEYLFALALGDPPMLNDAHSKEKFIKKTQKYSDLISKMLAKAKLEITRLTASHQALKGIPRRSPSPQSPKINNSFRLTTAPITNDISLSLKVTQRSNSATRQDVKPDQPQIVTPKISAPITASLPKLQTPALVGNSPEENPPVEEARTDRENQNKQSERDLLTMVLNSPHQEADELSPDTPESAKQAFMVEQPLELEEPMASPSPEKPESPQPSKKASSKANLFFPQQKDPEDTSEPSEAAIEHEEAKERMEIEMSISPSELAILPAKVYEIELSQRDAIVFRKFLEAMRLDDNFNEDSGKFSMKEPDKELEEYVKAYKTILESVEVPPQLYEELVGERGFVKLLEGAAQLGVYEFERDSGAIRLYSWHKRKIQAVAQQMRYYLEHTKLLTHRLLLTERQANILRALEGKSIFEGISVSNVLLEPHPRQNVILFRSSKAGEAAVRAQLNQQLNKLTMLKIQLSALAWHILELRAEGEALGVLQRARARGDCVIQVDDVEQSRDQDFFMVPGDSEEASKEQERIKLKVEREVAYPIELRFYSASPEAALAAESEVRGRLETLQGSKKFFKMGKEQWPRVQSKFGQRGEKTDFAIHLERRLRVLLFPAETEKFRGVMIYGDEEPQKVAFLEIGRIFELHQLLRREIPLSRTLALLLTPQRRAKLAARLKEEFPQRRAELLLEISGESGKASALVYALSEGKDLEDVMDRALEFLSMCEQKIRYEVVDNLWALKGDPLARVVARTQGRTLCHFNETLVAEHFIVPQFGEHACWMRQQEVEEGDTVKRWERYEREQAEALDRYEGDQVFLLGRSNFNLPQGREDAWHEQTDETRYRVKKGKVPTRLEEPKVRTLAPRALLIRGFPNDVARLRAGLTQELEKLETASSWYQVEGREWSAEDMAKVEHDYGVKVKLEGERVEITGFQRDAAFSGLTKIGERPAQIGEKLVELDPESEEFKREARLFREQMRYSRRIKVDKIERVEEPQQRARYQHEKQFMDSALSEDTERTLFQCRKAENLDQLEHPCHLRGKIFAASPRYFYDGRAGCQQVMVARVLLGMRYRAAKHESEWPVPPKIIQEAFLGEESDDEDQTEHKPSLNSVLKQPERELAEHYDSVELLSEKGQAFVVFHQDHALPSYLISFSTQPDSARSSFSGAAD